MLSIEINATIAIQVQRGSATLSGELPAGKVVAHGSATLKKMVATGVGYVPLPTSVTIDVVQTNVVKVHDIGAALLEAEQGNLIVTAPPTVLRMARMRAAGEGLTPTGARGGATLPKLSSGGEVQVPLGIRGASKMPGMKTYAEVFHPPLVVSLKGTLRTPTAKGTASMPLAVKGRATAPEMTSGGSALLKMYAHARAVIPRVTAEGYLHKEGPATIIAEGRGHTNPITTRGEAKMTSTLLGAVTVPKIEAKGSISVKRPQGQQGPRNPYVFIGIQ